MQTKEEIKNIVRDKYAQIVTEADQKESCGCGCNCGPAGVDYSIMSDSYDAIEGHIPDADLSLGCGLPTEYAGLKPGNTVIDLGSGAGNDMFIARKIVGPQGKIVGVDFTQEMVDKARANNAKLGFDNVSFEMGEIESLPFENDFADVVISNCVLNLVPDKQTAFSEIYRTLKPGGHFCISDIVVKGQIPEGLREPDELYAGCISGALEQEEYLTHIHEAGFHSIEIKKAKNISIPDELLQRYLDEDEIRKIKSEEFGIFSITVVGIKK